jgi:hypothetical protein
MLLAGNAFINKLWQKNNCEEVSPRHTAQHSIHLSQISCWIWFYYFIASCVRASPLATIKRRQHITVPSTAVVNPAKCLAGKREKIIDICGNC